MKCGCTIRRKWLWLATLATVVCLRSIAALTLRAGGEKLPTAADVKTQQDKYAQERDDLAKRGMAKIFPPQFLERAETFAQRGAAALKAGRLLQAQQALRQARWQLPYAGPEVPKHVARVLGDLRLRHSGSVNAVAYSPDGNFLATGSDDRTVKIWDMDSGREVRRMLGHGDRVRALAYSPDGKLIASAGGDDFIKLWDAKTGKVVRTLTGKKDSSGYVTAVAFSPDGKYLLSAWDDRAVRIHTVADGSIKRTMGDFRQVVNHVAFSPDGKLLATAAGDGQVRLYPYPDIVENVNRPEHWSEADLSGASYHIDFRPDSQQFARCFLQGIKIYNTIRPGARPPGTVVERTIPPPQPEPGSAAKVVRFKCSYFTQDGKMLITAASDGLIRLYDLTNGQVMGTYKGHNDGVTALAIHPSGTELVSASLDHTVRRWPFDVVAQSREFTGHTGPVWMADLSPDGQRVVSGSADRTVKVWDRSTGKEVLTLRGHTAPVTAVRYSPTGKMILSAAGDQIIKLWEANTGQLLRDLKGHNGTVTTAAFGPDGKMVVSGGADQLIKIWDADTGKELLNIDQARSIIAAVVFHPDGKSIATGHVDQTIRIWDVATGKEREKWFAHADSVSNLAFSADGKLLASCGADQLVKVWQTSSPEKTPLIFAGHKGSLSAVAFHPSGRFLISAGADHIIKLWKLAGGSSSEAAQDFRGHKDWTSSLIFSRDGYFFVSASVDKTIRLWELTTREIPLQAEHTGAVTAVAVSADGKLLASGAGDRTIKIWDMRTGHEVRTLRGHNGNIIALDFSRDGKVLVSSGADRNIFRWNVATGERLPDDVGHRHHLLNFPAPVRLIQVMPDNKQLLAWVGTPPRTTVNSYDLATGTKKLEGKDPARQVSSAAFSPAGKKAALGGKDGSVRIFDIEKRWTILPGGDWFLFGNTEAVTSLALSPGAMVLAAGNDKGIVKIGTVADRNTQHTIKAHEMQVRICRLSPDGKRLATVGQENVIKLWDVATGKELRQWDIRSPIQYYDAFVSDLVFTPDGSKLISANSNTTIYVLELP